MEKFSISEYELRNKIPRFLTDPRRRRLDAIDRKSQSEQVFDAILRVSSQLDWVAQLLGFNGDNYWPRTKLTVNERRSYLLGTHGVYERNLKPYEQQPFPFNRSEILVSGDRSFRFNSDFSNVIPQNQKINLEYYNKFLYAGAEYYFLGQIEIISGNVLFFEYDALNNISTVRFNNPGVIELKEINSNNTIFFQVIDWKDITDWDTVGENFEGVWSQKGGFFPLHFVFDSLNIHGYNDDNLVIENIKLKIDPQRICPIIFDNSLFRPSNLESQSSLTLRINDNIDLKINEQSENFSLNENFELLRLNPKEQINKLSIIYDNILDNDVYNDETIEFTVFVDEGDFSNLKEKCIIDEGLFSDIDSFIPSTIEFDIEFNNININNIFNIFNFRPDTRNSETQLRVWNPKDLHQNDSFTYFNPLIADENEGPRVKELLFRYAFRLPPNYERDGNKWSLTKLMAQNFSYLGKELSLELEERVFNLKRPINYHEDYLEPLQPGSLIYREDYLTSTTNLDDCSFQIDWEPSKIKFEQEVPAPIFDYAFIEHYDALDSRISIQNGDWKGEYYCGFTGKGILSGNTVEDLNLGRIELTSQPEFDFSEFKIGYLPDNFGSDIKESQDYRVGYAFFAADLSAPEEPVFDFCSNFYETNK